MFDKFLSLLFACIDLDTGREAVVLLLLTLVILPVQLVIAGGVKDEVGFSPVRDREGGFRNGQTVVSLPEELRVVECQLKLDIFFEGKGHLQNRLSTRS